MERTKYNANDQPPNKASGNFLQPMYPFNQVPIHQNVPPHYSDMRFNSAPGYYPSQMDATVSKNYPSVPQYPRFAKPPSGDNGCFSVAPPNHPSSVGNIPLQNSNYHFQSFSPTLLPATSSSSQVFASSTQTNHRPLFNTPPPSVMCNINTDSMQFGQLNFPPPPISASTLHCNPSQQTFFPSVPIMMPSQSSSYQPSTMSQIISNVQSTNTKSDNEMVISEKENLLNNFLQKFNLKVRQGAKSDITVAEFRCCLKKCFSLYTLVESRRAKLISRLDSSQEEWEKEINCIKELQDQLSCSIQSLSKHLTTIQRKLKGIKRKRIRKKKLKTTLLEQRVKKEQERERQHQEIDKWLDNLKEKNEKMKRELEMKKEADNILAEVRRKIHEAKKTIEKLKVFEKLRSARQTNSVRKGLYLQPEHSAKFDAKISHLRETMLAQLENYEQEEKALQVMLETEQEDRREEEALWRKRKLMTFQQKKQRIILESLFGNSEEPAPDDPLFLFYQYQNSGNKSLENLVQIRHHWDVHLSEEGESIPLPWVIAAPPSNSLWEEYLTA